MCPRFCTYENKFQISKFPRPLDLGGLMGNSIVFLGSSFCITQNWSKYAGPFNQSWVTRFVPVTSGQHFQNLWTCHRSPGLNFSSKETFAEPFARHGSTWPTFSYLLELVKFSRIFGSSIGYMCPRFCTSHRNFQISKFAEIVNRTSHN